MPNCEYCHAPIPEGLRAGAKYCSNAHRQASYAVRRTVRDLNPVEHLKLVMGNIAALEARIAKAREQCLEIVNRHNLERDPEALKILGGER